MTAALRLKMLDDKQKKSLPGLLYVSESVPKATPRPFFEVAQPQKPWNSSQKVMGEPLPSMPSY
jgi:hypothetical protein